MKFYVYALLASLSMQQILQAAHAGNPLIDQLNAAFRNNQEDVFIKLLDANPDFDVNTPLDADQNTGLHDAAAKGWTAATKKLLQRSANPNAKNIHRSNPGTTPLMMAADADITKLLIQAGANINEKTVRNKSALYLATFSNKPKQVKLLLEAGANFEEVEDFARKQGLTNMVNIFEQYRKIRPIWHQEAYIAGSRKMASSALEHGMQQTERGKKSIEAQQLTETVAQYLRPERITGYMQDKKNINQPDITSIMNEYQATSN